MFQAEKRGGAKALRREYSLSDSSVLIGCLVDGRHGVLCECWLPLDTWTRGAWIQGLSAWCSRQVWPISLPSTNRLRKAFPGGTVSPPHCFTQPSLTHCLSRLRCWRAGRLLSSSAGSSPALGTPIPKNNSLHIVSTILFLGTFRIPITQMRKRRLRERTKFTQGSTAGK